MTRNRLLIVALSVLVVILGAGVAYDSVSGFRFGSRLRHDERRLAAVQFTLEVSQKASTKTRVATVTQRCQLTSLVLGVLVRVHDTADAAPFQKSFRICETQLATVKRINAETPTPKP